MLNLIFLNPLPIMIPRHILPILFLAFSTQLFSQNQQMTSTLYAKRLVTNHHTDIMQHSPLDLENYRGGFEIAYGKNISKLLNVVFPFKTSVFRMPEDTENKRYFSLGGQFHLHHNMGKTFSPYLLGGAGMLIMAGEMSEVQLPIGLGINIKVNDNIGFNLQTEFRASIDGDHDHYQHGLGMFFNFGNLGIEEPPIEIEAPDRDNDSKTYTPYPLSCF
ncbi:MAG: hypothetical protein HKN16_01610, partial [Saprospiraceae bacterium]|nr:hypothetical protein [Saprospiraceae bacterium]